MNRGKEIVTLWLPGTQHSYVRIIVFKEKAKIQFQNEKFDVKEVDLNPKDLISLFKVEKFFER